MAAADRPYQMCTRTVMDTTDKTIWFDDNGVCSHALMFDKTMAPIVEAANSGGRRGELENLVEKVKKSGEGKPYDCIIGVSGGVDSSYMILQAVKLGLRPLAVHLDSGWNSELAVENIKNIISTLGVDLHTDVVDWIEMRDLQLSFFKASVPNCDIPTDHALPSVAYGQALKHGIKYIFSGTNLSSESILPKSWGYRNSDAIHVKGIQKKFGTVKLDKYPITGLFKRFLYYEKIKGIQSVRLLDYMPYFPLEAKRVITEELGWQDYGGKHFESVFTRYFQGYYLPHKFNIDKRKAHYSSLILSNQMTRDEALILLEVPPYDEKLRLSDEKYIAEKLGVQAEELRNIFDRPPANHLDYPNINWLWNFAYNSAKFLHKITHPKGMPFLR